jgi:hypothetical protein
LLAFCVLEIAITIIGGRLLVTACKMTLYISISNMFWMSNIPISSEPTLAVKSWLLQLGCCPVVLRLSCSCPMYDYAMHCKEHQTDARLTSLLYRIVQIPSPRAFPAYSSEFFSRQNSLAVVESLVQSLVARLQNVLALSSLQFLRFYF